VVPRQSSQFRHPRGAGRPEGDRPGMSRKGERARVPVCAYARVPLFLLTIYPLDSRRNVSVKRSETIRVNIRSNADGRKHAYSAFPYLSPIISQRSFIARPSCILAHPREIATNTSGFAAENNYELLDANNYRSDRNSRGGHCGEILDFEQVPLLD